MKHIPTMEERENRLLEALEEVEEAHRPHARTILEGLRPKATGMLTEAHLSKLLGWGACGRTTQTAAALVDAGLLIYCDDGPPFHPFWSSTDKLKRLLRHRHPHPADILKEIHRVASEVTCQDPALKRISELVVLSGVFS